MIEINRRESQGIWKTDREIDAQEVEGGTLSVAVCFGLAEQMEPPFQRH